MTALPHSYSEIWSGGFDAETSPPEYVQARSGVGRFAMMKNPRYVIAVPDLARSGRFYRDVLGFDVHTIPDPGWLFFVRGDCFVMAGECRDAIPPSQLGDHSYFAYVEVDDVRAYHQRLVASGCEIVKPLRDEPWGMTEFGIRTADGHRMMFAAATAES